MTLSDLALPHAVWLVAIAATCGAAFWRGRGSERAGAAIILGGWAATVAVAAYDGWDRRWAVLGVDFAAFLLLTVLALRSSRYWPLVAAGLQFVAVVTHAARLLDPTVGGWAYISAGRIWGYLLLVPLAVGVAGAARDRLIDDAALRPPDGDVR